jgi:hypothetical protein
MKRKKTVMGAMVAAAVVLVGSSDSNAQVIAPIGLNTALTTAFTPFLSTMQFVPNLAMNQVVISSSSAAFTGLFGPAIIAPIATNGTFAVSAPFALGGFAGVPLFANFTGALPFANGLIAAGPLTSIGFGFGTPFGALGPFTCGAALPFACSNVVF